MNKAIKYGIWAFITILVVYNSVYFKKLDEVKAIATAQQFDAKVYASKFWQKLQPVAANTISIDSLKLLLKANPDSAFNTYSHALGIGNVRYILVKGEGTVKAVYEDEVGVTTTQDSAKKIIRIATEYIFGNAVRDASGLMNVSEFSNSTDFNNVSSEINSIIRKEVLPSFKANVKNGSVIAFTGAIELNKKHLNLDDIELIPVSLNILKP